MIEGFMLLLGGIKAILHIYKQDRLIQLQNEQIQEYREALELKDKAIQIYRQVTDLPQEQDSLLKTRLAMLQQEVGHE